MRSVTLLLLAVAAGCAAPPPPAEPVARGRTWTGPASSIETEEYHRIVAPGDWDALWRRHAGPDDPVPGIDFARNMVIACFSARTFPLDFKQVAVTRNDRELLVFFSSHVGDMKPATPPERRPFCILELPRTGIAVVIRGRWTAMVGQPFEIERRMPALRE